MTRKLKNRCSNCVHKNHNMREATFFSMTLCEANFEIYRVTNMTISKLNENVIEGWLRLRNVCIMLISDLLPTCWWLACYETNEELCATSQFIQISTLITFTHKLMLTALNCFNLLAWFQLTCNANFNSSIQFVHWYFGMVQSTHTCNTSVLRFVVHTAVRRANRWVFWEMAHHCAYITNHNLAHTNRWS